MVLLVLLIAASVLSWWGHRRDVRRAWLVWLPYAAPLVAGIGLLVTVVQLQAAFDDAGEADPSSKASLLATGVSSAMNATALGIGGAAIILAACAVLFALAGPRAQGSRDTTVS